MMLEVFVGGSCLIRVSAGRYSEGKSHKSRKGDSSLAKANKKENIGQRGKKQKAVYQNNQTQGRKGVCRFSVVYRNT